MMHLHMCICIFLHIFTDKLIDLAFIYLKDQTVLPMLVTFQLPTTLPSTNFKEENVCYLEIGFTSGSCSLFFLNLCHNRPCDYTYKGYKIKKTSNNALLFSIITFYFQA